MRQIPQIRQIVSFIFALHFDINFLMGVFGDLKTLGKSSTELPGVENILKIMLLACKHRQNSSAGITREHSCVKFQNLMINPFWKQGCVRLGYIWFEACSIGILEAPSRVSFLLPIFLGGSKGLCSQGKYNVSWLYVRWHQWSGMFPIETSTVTLDNSRVLTVKLGRKTSLVAYSTDKRSINDNH